MNTIERLQKWYLAQCNGVWEHSSGIVIESLDNPGWQMKINLKGTQAEKKDFKPVTKNVTPLGLDQAMGKVQPPYSAENPFAEEWMACFVRDGRFEGAGDGSRLDEIVSVFLNWVEVP